MTVAATRPTGGPYYSHGPSALAAGGVEFRLWAPAQSLVALAIEGRDPLPMRPVGEGWHVIEFADVPAGTRYGFRLEDGRVVPDPASRFQPDDVHALSAWVDTRQLEFKVPWSGRRWEECVLYELHIGTFTPEGTFRAAIGKLDHLAGLGITALEIMPVADFAGRRNWGYDGVYAYAPDASYGTPQDFASLIDAAHARGIAVLLDVVYNHFGPEGNYLGKYAPHFFTDRHHTPWGAGVNVDGDSGRAVREFFIDNALFWLREYRLDGLRLDAVHAIADDSALHVLDDLAERVRAEIADRPVHLVLENEDNEASYLARNERGEPALFTAQWNDDIHHVLHVAATRESAAYYHDYPDDTRLTARAIAEGFAFQGEVMRSRGRSRGEPAAHLPPTAFVSFIQNHDQIGNRAYGERLGMLVPEEKLRVIAAIYLLAPQVPMLFMGEEWNARQPFRFFCDFEGDLADAVRNGRREEFKRFPEFADPEKRAHIPDPLAPETFAASKLRWEDRSLPPCAATLRWYTQILAARRANIIPLMPRIRGAGESHIIATNAVFVSWRTGEGHHLQLCANLSEEAHEFPSAPGRVIWQEGAAPRGATMPPWSVRWTVREP